MSQAQLETKKKAYLSHKFKTDPAGFWKTLRWLNINSSPISAPEDIASVEEFNEYFANSVPNVNINFLDNTFLSKYSSSSSEGVQSILNFTVVDEHTVSGIITKIKSNARGADGLDVKMVSLLLPYLLRHITFIINSCLQTSTFPSAWKTANIIPVAKISNPLTLANFRPISILPMLSKILEKTVSEQLANHFYSSKIIPITQSGFRPRHGTATALIKVGDDILKATDEGKNSCLILLDYSKAFDTLDHQMLFAKLRYFGLSHSALAFMKSYLYNRDQRVVLGSSASSSICVGRGVPQGSVLGPLLFSIYTADFCNYLNYLNSHQYADDFQLYFSFDTNFLEVQNIINSDLNIIHDISTAHGLLLNASKTQLLGFGRSSAVLAGELNITLNNVKIGFSESCKSLGVYFDSSFRFGHHVSYVLQKCYTKLKTLYLFKDFLDTSVKLRLTDSLILSHISYCDVLYWPALVVKDKRSLQKLANACLRFSYGVRKYDHISPYYMESGWLRLEERFKVHVCCMVYKINLFQEPQYLFDKLIKMSTVHQFTTRHNNLYSIPRHRTALYERSFTYNAMKLFNSLPICIKESTSVSTFKKRIKAYIKSQ